MVAIRIEVLTDFNNWKGPWCVYHPELWDDTEWKQIWKQIPTTEVRFDSNVRHYFTPIGWQQFGKKAFEIAQRYWGDRVRKVTHSQISPTRYQDAYQCVLSVS